MRESMFYVYVYTSCCDLQCHVLLMHSASFRYRTDALKHCYMNLQFVVLLHSAPAQHCKAVLLKTFLIGRTSWTLWLFYRSSSYASSVLAVVNLSVCPSVRHKRALWQNQTMHCRYFDTIHERAITLLFWHQQWLAGNASLRRNVRSKWPTPSKNADLDRFPLITSQP